MSRVKQQPETRYCEWITPNTKTSTTPAWKYVRVILTINSFFQSPLNSTVVNRPTLYMTMSSTTTTSSSSPKQKGPWYGSNRMIQSKRGFGNVKPRGHQHMSEIHAILSVGVCVCVFICILFWDSERNYSVRHTRKTFFMFTVDQQVWWDRTIVPFVSWFLILFRWTFTIIIVVMTTWWWWFI